MMESQGFISKILVLPPGGSGTIPVTLVSESDEDYAATLYIEPEGLGDARMYRGIRFTFSPTSMLLRAGGTESSILKVEVDSTAPTGFYGGSVGMRFGDGGALSGGEAYFNLLILPYTPDYAFYIYAEPQGPTPLPTPAPTPVPQPPTVTPPTPTILQPPTIVVKAGGRLHVLFVIQTFSEDPNLLIQLNLGSTPSGISRELLRDPVQVVRVPIEERLYMLVLTVSPDVAAGTHKITVTGNVGTYSFERAFYLTVTS